MLRYALAIRQTSTFITTDLPWPWLFLGGGVQISGAPALPQYPPALLEVVRMRRTHVPCFVVLTGTLLLVVGDVHSVSDQVFSA